MMEREAEIANKNSRSCIFFLMYLMEANLTSSFLCFSTLSKWHQSRHIMLARGRISPVSVIDNVQSPGEVRAGKCDVAVSEAHVFIAGFGHGLS